MAAQLTERQQEIKALLDKGNTPAEVGKALGISENAVYQARARIRKATRKRGGSTKRTTGRKSGASTRTRTRRSTTPRTGLLSPTDGGTGTTANTVTDRPTTPLQAVRARQAEIKASLHESEKAVADARRELAKVEELYEKATARVNGELAKLNAAEAALTGAKPAPKRRSSSKQNGSGSRKAAQAAAQAAPAAQADDAKPEAQTAPDAAQGPSVSEAEAEAIREAPGEERPGVPVDPDFERSEEEAAAVAADGEGFSQEDGFGEE